MYKIVIKGTTFSVTVAIRLMPPMMTTPVIIAKNIPIMKPADPPSKSPTLIICAAAWLAWKALPPPKAPPTQRTKPKLK